MDLVDRGILFRGYAPQGLNIHYGVDTSIMSQIESDDPCGPFHGTRAALASLGVVVSTVPDPELFIVHRVCELVGTRAARLSATALAAVVEQTGNDKTTKNLHVGVDGTVIEMYPHFDKRVREALKEILGEATEARIKIAIAKDGSGAGGNASQLVSHLIASSDGFHFSWSGGAASYQTASSQNFREILKN
jgi:hexokinase